VRTARTRLISPIAEGNCCTDLPALKRQIDGEGTIANHGANACTAMAVLALTVEYRYLPIYRRSAEPPARTGRKRAGRGRLQLCPDIIAADM
jgi:hypothetical protein